MAIFTKETRNSTISTCYGSLDYRFHLFIRRSHISFNAASLVLHISSTGDRNININRWEGDISSSSKQTPLLGDSHPFPSNDDPLDLSGALVDLTMNEIKSPN